MERGNGGTGILTTRTGLVIPSDLAFDDWADAGFRISRLVDSFAWCLGDWLIYGQERYERRYAETVERVGLEYQTLRNYAWIARKFPIGRRREELSFQHHTEVAALPEPEQDHWLDLAAEKGWSRNRLRIQLRNHRRAAQRADRKAAELPRVRVSTDRIDTWQKAAAELNTSLDAWIVQALDRAAAQALGATGGQR
ncbi:LmbU family transcriptional regulator [Micromonospora sp. NPDC049048]|uniref:LmbU family transcriptional regulator n=1 Tax=unclassified Micromonospora TaxID=2617518 RepID=UPI00371AFD39